MEPEIVTTDFLNQTLTEHLKINYGSEEVYMGNELTPTMVKNPPAVTWNANKTTYYTLLMIDPDAPSRDDPKFSEVNHWLVGNILGLDLANGDTITEYLGSGPPKGTGFHRYIFLLYKQKQRHVFDEPRTTKTSRAHRFNFSAKKFARKYNLEDPVAGNFFRAQWDSYVDERNKFITN